MYNVLKRHRLRLSPIYDEEDDSASTSTTWSSRRPSSFTTTSGSACTSESWKVYEQRNVASTASPELPRRKMVSFRDENDMESAGEAQAPAPPPPSPMMNRVLLGAANASSGSPFPRTNPYATLPRYASVKRTKHYASSEGFENSTGSITDATVTTQEATHWKYDRRYARKFGQTEEEEKAKLEQQRILAGLKSFGIKGELLLSLMLNRGLLTVSIEEAKNLVSPSSSGCCSTYVRVSLMPDEDKRSLCKTEIVPYTNCPVFNQTFTVEILPEDYEKRVLISMWHREAVDKKSVLMGCMSFTIRHMVESNKIIDGWYFLLSPEYGRRKHLAAHKLHMRTYYGSVDSDLQNRGLSEKNYFTAFI